MDGHCLCLVHCTLETKNITLYYYSIIKHDTQNIRIIKTQSYDEQFVSRHDEMRNVRWDRENYLKKWGNLRVFKVSQAFLFLFD